MDTRTGKDSFGRSSESRATGHGLALALGTIASGLAAYGYIAVGTRVYGPAAFAPVAVIWSLWPAAVAAFAFPLEQWIARELAHDREAEARIAAMLRGAVPLIIGICLCGGLISWAAGARLFGEAGVLYPLLLVGVCLGAASMGVLRGGLAGHGRYRESALATALESLIRLVPAAAVAAASFGVEVFAATLLVGPFVGLFWRSEFKYRRDESGVRHDVSGIRDLASAALLGQIVFAAPPVILAVFVGATEAVTAVFVSLALMRAPYLVAVGISVRAVPRLTSTYAHAQPDRLAVALRRVVSATSVAMVAAAVLAPLVLPPIIELIFGEGTVPSSAALAGLAAGVVGAHGTLAAMLVLLAAGRNEVARRAWLIGIAANVLLLAIPGVAEEKVTIAFAGAELAALLTMALLVRRYPAAGDPFGPSVPTSGKLSK